MKVMLVCQHAALRQCLREIVEREGDLGVVAQARDVEEAAIASRAVQPDVVVLDVSLASGSGIATIRRTRRRPLRVIVIGLTCDREHVLHALRAGACGYLRAEDAAEELVTAIRLASPERPYLGAGIDRAEILPLLARSTRPTVLVIEDDPQLAEATKAALEAASYSVLLTDSVDEGLRLAREERPDSIILDVKLPPFSEGLQFVWELRKDNDRELRNTPVVALASVDGKLRGGDPDQPSVLWEPYRYLPVQGFVCKPLAPTDLLERIESLLPARKGR